MSAGEKLWWDRKVKENPLTLKMPSPCKECRDTKVAVTTEWKPGVTVTKQLPQYSALHSKKAQAHSQGPSNPSPLVPSEPEFKAPAAVAMAAGTVIPAPATSSKLAKLSDRNLLVLTHILLEGQNRTPALLETLRSELKVRFENDESIELVKLMMATS